MPLPRRIYLLPLTFFLAGSLGTVFLFLRIERVEQTRIVLENRLLAEQVGRRLETFIDDRAGLLSHLADRQFRSADDVRRRFAERAGQLVGRYPSFQAINWVRPSGEIAVVVPDSTNPGVLGRNLNEHPDPAVQTAIQLAAAQDGPLRTPLIQLLQGGKGFAIYQQLTDLAGRPLGLVNGVFRIEPLVDACLPDSTLRRRVSFELIEGQTGLAYRHLGDPEPPDGTWLVDVPVRVVDREMTLHLSPTASHLASASTPADEILAVLGVLLVAGLAYLLHLLLRRQEALRASQARYRLLVENQQDLVVQLDRDGCFQYVSPSLCAAAGRPEKELLGTSFLDLVQEEDRERTAGVLARLVRPPYHAYDEHRSLTVDGNAWQAWSLKAVRDNDGLVQAVTAVGRDITRRRVLEEQLVVSRKLQAVGQLAGGIAHDFNNLLQAMLGNLQFVVQDTNPTGQTAEDLQEIERGIERAMTLTRQLLAFSQRQRTLPQRQDLRRLLENVVRESGPRLPDGVTLDLALPNGELPVAVDPHQVEQVFRNLLDNAREAVGRRGSITVAARRCELDESDCADTPHLAPGPFVAVEVRDDGPGMAPETASRVFEPFFTTKAVGAGTGLGLAAAIGIASRHEGTIRVASAPGAGAVFTVLLPSAVRDEGTTETTGTAQTDVAGADATILVVEDEPSVRELAARALRRVGYEVLTAADGREAVAVFGTRPATIDLVLLDMVMPHMGGRETCAALRAIRADVPVLFASGFDPGALREEQEVGPDDEILAKPYGIPELLTHVRRVLARASA
ncbi:PAS domain S-box protein [bacterium]|nr:PAS domain S-box protein [bacterium]